MVTETLKRRQVRQHGLAHANKVDNDVLKALMELNSTVNADITKLNEVTISNRQI